MPVSNILKNSRVAARRLAMHVYRNINWDVHADEEEPETKSEDVGQVLLQSGLDRRKDAIREALEAIEGIRQNLPIREENDQLLKFDLEKQDLIHDVDHLRKRTGGGTPKAASANSGYNSSAFSRNEEEPPSKVGAAFLVVFVILAMIAMYYSIFYATHYLERQELDSGGNSITMAFIPPHVSWVYHNLTDIETAKNGNCLSLNERHHFFPDSKKTPSREFITRLREYEVMHKTCVGEVNSFEAQFTASRPDLKDCKYLLWKNSSDDIGEKLLSLLSAFEYALLTNRSLLVNSDGSLENILCDPLPWSSIWTPVDFPLEELYSAPYQSDFLEGKTSHSGGKDTGRKDLVLAYLRHDYNDIDGASKFFCNSCQEKFKTANWMLWNSNQYVSPALFLVPSFDKLLRQWFPDRHISMHSARYLLLPSNKVWRSVRKAHAIYGGGKQGEIVEQGPSGRASRVGLHVATGGGYDPEVSMRLAGCLSMEKVVPEPMSEEKWDALSKDPQWLKEHEVSRKASSMKGDLVSLLVVSQESQYYSKLKAMFNERPTEGDRVVAVHMESSGKEGSGLSYAEKAMADVTLLAMSDSLFVSAKSSLGYVAEALHGPGAYYVNCRDGEWQQNGKPVCEHAWSSNACFQMKPLGLKCPNESPHAFEDTNTWLPYVKQCQDSTVGLVVVPESKE